MRSTLQNTPLPFNPSAGNREDCEPELGISAIASATDREEEREARMSLSSDGQRPDFIEDPPGDFLGRP